MRSPHGLLESSELVQQLPMYAPVNLLAPGTRPFPYSAPRPQSAFAVYATSFTRSGLLCHSNFSS